MKISDKRIYSAITNHIQVVLTKRMLVMKSTRHEVKSNDYLAKNICSINTSKDVMGTRLVKSAKMS